MPKGSCSHLKSKMWWVLISKSKFKECYVQNKTLILYSYLCLLTSENCFLPSFLSPLAIVTATENSASKHANTFCLRISFQTSISLRQGLCHLLYPLQLLALWQVQIMYMIHPDRLVTFCLQLHWLSSLDSRICSNISQNQSLMNQRDYQLWLIIWNLKVTCKHYEYYIVLTWRDETSQFQGRFLILLSSQYRIYFRLYFRIYFRK